MKTSLLEELIKAFGDKTHVQCPFDEEPPKDAEILEVPHDVRRVLTIWQRLLAESRELLKEKDSHESRAWMWRHGEAAVVETLARRHLQTKHNRTRAHQVEYYSGWKFRFVLS